MRRAARGLAAALAVVLAVVPVLFGFAVVLTARSGDPVLYPAPADGPTVTVFVVSFGYHTGFVVPRHLLARLAAERGHAALGEVSARFTAYPWIEAGWGEEVFYRSVPTAESLTVGLAARALLRPGNASVMHVVGLSAEPKLMVPAADVVRIDLSEAGFARLVARLETSFARSGGGGVEDLGPGLYGPSRFFRATGTFHLFRVCNHWTADLLDAAGVPTAPALATLPQGLLLDLRWRSNLRPVP